MSTARSETPIDTEGGAAWTAKQLQAFLQAAAGHRLLPAFLLLALGLSRGWPMPKPAIALIVKFLIVDAVGAVAGIKEINLIAHALLIIGSGWIGRRVLAMKPTEWNAHGDRVATAA